MAPRAPLLLTRRQRSMRGFSPSSNSTDLSRNSFRRGSKVRSELSTSTGLSKEIEKQYNNNNDKDSGISSDDEESIPKSIVTTDTNNSTQKQTHNSTNIRKMTLIETYNCGNKVRRNEDTMRRITRAVRKSIIPKVKFISNSNVFGSFDQPDFSDPGCWVNKLFENIPTLDKASDKVKAEVWMTYKHKVKEQFSLHRSNVTLKIKKNFIKGTSFILNFTILSYFCLT